MKCNCQEGPWSCKHANVADPPAWVKDGARVIYQSSPGPGYAHYGTIDGEPWLLGEHTWVVRLRDMSPSYRNGERKHVNAAALTAIRPATEP